MAQVKHTDYVGDDMSGVRVGRTAVDNGERHLIFRHPASDRHAMDEHTVHIIADSAKKLHGETFDGTFPLVLGGEINTMSAHLAHCCRDAQAFRKIGLGEHLHDGPVDHEIIDNLGFRDPTRLLQNKPGHVLAEPFKRSNVTYHSELPD